MNLSSFYGEGYAASELAAKPLVLVIGQYSTGKTTFISTLKQQQAAVAAQNMYEALQRKERAAAIEIESIANQMRELLAKIEKDPPKKTADVNKWWEILYQMNIADGALLNETAWSALVGMSKKNARDAAKAELAAE